MSVQNVAVNISSLSGFFSLSLVFLHCFFPLSAKNTIKEKKNKKAEKKAVYFKRSVGLGMKELFQHPDLF